MVATFLPREEGCRVLIGLLVPLVAIRIWKFRVTSFLSVGIVTDGQICSSSKGWPKVEGVEYCTFLVDQGHFLFQGKREQEGILSDVSMESVGS